MTDMRKKGPAGTLQQQIFRLLRQHPNQTASQMARALGHDRESCRKAAERMAKVGTLARERMSGGMPCRIRVIYSVVRCRREPTDMRGKRPTSRNCRGAVAYSNWITMMQKKHGPTWRPPQARILDNTAAMLLGVSA